MTDHHDEMRVSPDPSQAEDLRQRLHARMARASQDVHGESDLDLDFDEHGDAPATEDDVHRRPRRGGRPLVVALAGVAVLALVAGAVALLRIDGDDAAPITTDPALPPNGWVAFSGSTERLSFPGAMGGDVYLVREGESPRRVAGSDTDMSDQVCPAFSPDGGRLVFGQATLWYRSGRMFYEDDAELVTVEVGADGSTSGTTTIPLEGLSFPPCPMWSPDGRWLAFGAGSDPAQQEFEDTEVWLVDTVTEELRRLAGYAPTDLEWLPGSDELAIADNGIHVYSLTTGDVRSLGIEGAEELAWSPDGTTVAFQRASTSLWLVDADGTNERQLTADPITQTQLIDGSVKGVGPVWSPDGRFIAYQRAGGSCCTTQDVVLVTAIADDADNPIGTETVIAPPTTPGTNGPVSWHPRSVTWSPDGSMLLYIASEGALAVPVDTTKAPFILADASWTVDGGAEDPMQTWGRQPLG